MVGAHVLEVPFVNEKSAQIENGDKVIMPPSALDRLASLHIDYPMLFELRNAATERVSHCGVLEFIAEEGMIYMPYWVDDGESIATRGRLCASEKCNSSKGYIRKIATTHKGFLGYFQSKSYVKPEWFHLETTLRNFSCLSTGDSIMVAYNNKKYYIDIIEAKPSHAISIIETDCEVDFAPPLDYKEPERPSAPVSTGKAPAEGQEPPEESEPKFNPFTGVGRRLDGKGLKTGSPPVSSSVPQDRCANTSAGGTGTASSSSSQTAKAPTQGKLVFGSNANRTKDAPKDASKAAKAEPPKSDDPKFQPFSGKKYSLRG
ncbi:hypothetical protein SASPL_126172 [Salvia splendens]|uniref:Ubiquitin fusion degradation protein 1 n=1 Tax=Salvia splendens TaxID=180675 RepID=A0A8X8XLB9_SALSN|nr:hypothetical protein SASPL_126172 [Salvia splendens]